MKAYLEALEIVNAPKPKGRRRSMESLQERLVAVASEFDGADAMGKLRLATEQVELEQEIAQREQEAEPIDITDLEAAFIEVAAEYATGKGVPYAAWRMLKVPPRVLRAAGVPKSGTPLGSMGRLRSVGRM